MFGEKLREECAIVGVSVQNNEAVGIIYNSLLAMQHRGQEGSGIATLHDSRIYCEKSVGLVNEVFDSKRLNKIPKSSIAVGHNRYSTTGANSVENCGPFVTEFLLGRIATAHNGNITNAKQIKEKLAERGILFNATSDSEVISALIAYYITQGCPDTDAVIKASKEISGAFSLIILSHENRLVAMRDPDGYRPLCIGERDGGVVIASESCALDSCGFNFIRDVLPGEVVVVENGKIIHSEVVLEKKAGNGGLCIFEYVYFARPDSVIDNLSVYTARLNMGKALAREYPADADVVCGVPDSGLEAAIGYSLESQLPYVTGFMKNRYIGRSFIYPTQAQRENAVRLKLNPMSVNIKDKRIVLVDDSIVRGTTISRIVKSLKDAGAKEVHVRLSSPPFKFTCNYGTDIDNEENLIANQMSIEEIRKKIGADSLGYISLEGLEEACSESTCSFCTNCFSGNNKSDIKKNDLE